MAVRGTGSNSQRTGDRAYGDLMSNADEVREFLTTRRSRITPERAGLPRYGRLRRVPVYGETPDEIEGVLDAAALLRDPETHYTERLDVPSFVPGTMKAVTLLKSEPNHKEAAQDLLWALVTSREFYFNH